ncbi:hypothetical protein L1049_014768 [Liquidambar formosana]|uniref:CCHC-type domain-containing protein n=1 Tax=Liquidambar formosana TaxID=63359 RepID=A0AAP0WZ83_LIQFO
MESINGNLSQIISQTANLSCFDEVHDLVSDSSLADNKEDKLKILSVGPWSIRGLLLVFKEWSSGLVLEEIDFHSYPFWVQVHGLHPDFKSTDNVSKIGPKIGVLLDVDVPRSGQLVWNKFIRVRVDVDVRNPFEDWFFAEESWLSLRFGSNLYERLSDFCYRCGRLGHGEKYCGADIPTRLVDSVNPTHGVMAFGPWMRALSGSYRKASSIPSTREVRADGIQVDPSPIREVARPLQPRPPDSVLPLLHVPASPILDQ